MFLYEVRHAVVGDPGQVNGLRRRREQLDRRRRYREHLLILGEAVQHLEPDVEVVQHRHTSTALADVLEPAGDALDAF
jgi:hypothetical protein